MRVYPRIVVVSFLLAITGLSFADDISLLLIERNTPIQVWRERFNSNMSTIQSSINGLADTLGTDSLMLRTGRTVETAFDMYVTDAAAATQAVLRLSRSAVQLTTMETLPDEPLIGFRAAWDDSPRIRLTGSLTNELQALDTDIWRFTTAFEAPSETETSLVYYLEATHVVGVEDIIGSPDVDPWIIRPADADAGNSGSSVEITGGLGANNLGGAVVVRGGAIPAGGEPGYVSAAGGQESGDGGEIAVIGGDGVGDGSTGGTLELRGGEGYSGGAVQLISGLGTGTVGGVAGVYAGDGLAVGGRVEIAAGSGGSTGGSITITAGVGGATSGAITLTGGGAGPTGGLVAVAGGAGTVRGGDAQIAGGASAITGGHVVVWGGDAAVIGGAVDAAAGRAITGGYAAVAGGFGTNIGGSASIRGGASVSTGGAVYVTGGVGTNYGGAVLINGGSGGLSADKGTGGGAWMFAGHGATGGLAIVAGGNSASAIGGPVTIVGGNGTPSGGVVRVGGGTATTSAGAGGDLLLTGGGATTLGTGGLVRVVGGQASRFGGDVQLVSGTGTTSNGNVTVTAGTGEIIVDKQPRVGSSGYLAAIMGGVLYVTGNVEVVGNGTTISLTNSFSGTRIWMQSSGGINGTWPSLNFMTTQNVYGTRFGYDPAFNGFMIYRSIADRSVMWDAGNDGPSSGMDADTVDGYNSSAFLLVSSFQSVGLTRVAVPTDPTDPGADGQYAIDGLDFYFYSEDAGGSGISWVKVTGSTSW